VPLPDREAKTLQGWMNRIVARSTKLRKGRRVP
jgi:hypothetical protein